MGIVKAGKGGRSPLAWVPRYALAGELPLRTPEEITEYTHLLCANIAIKEELAERLTKEAAAAQVKLDIVTEYLNEDVE